MLLFFSPASTAAPRTYAFASPAEPSLSREKAETEETNSGKCTMIFLKKIFLKKKRGGEDVLISNLFISQPSVSRCRLLRPRLPPLLPLLHPP